MANLQKIKDLADSKKIPLSVIADKLDITPQALSKIMRTNSTKIETLEKIAEILKVSVSDFFPSSTSLSSTPSFYSPTTSGTGNIIKVTHNGGGEEGAAQLKERVRALEDIIKEKDARLEEKERLIQVLLKAQQKG